MRLEYGDTSVEVTPTKIIAVARNYRLHAEEMGSPLLETPSFFLKPPSSLIGNNGVVILPRMSQRVEHEVELAAIVKHRCKNVSPADAADHLLGYTVFVDVTARDLQAEAKKKGLSWAVAKGFDTFAPTGPRIAPARTFDPHHCDLFLTVNGTERQRGNTKDMLFSVEELLSSISSVMTLEPMDIIATGTPQGVGPLEEGDHVEAGIEGIGVLTFTVRREELNASKAPFHP